MIESRRVRAAAALAVAAIGWSLAPIFIRLCSEAFDPLTQAFVRYGSGTLMLAAICLVRWPAEFVHALRASRGVLGISAVNVVLQYIWTEGCYGSTATTAQLLIKLNIIFVIVIAYVVFQEERAVITSPSYLIGAIISLLGLAFVLAKDPRSLVPVFDRSSLLLILTAFVWAVYVVWGKHLSLRIHPVPMFGAIAVYTSIGLGAMALLLGDPGRVVAVTPPIWGVALVSGLVSIGIAHPAFQYAQRHLGSAWCSALILGNPLGTYFFSLVLLPDERLLPSQWLGAAVLLGGTALVVAAGRHGQARAIEAPDATGAAALPER